MLIVMLLLLIFRFADEGPMNFALVRHKASQSMKCHKWYNVVA